VQTEQIESEMADTDRLQGNERLVDAVITHPERYQTRRSKSAVSELVTPVL
jgi:hypothetical protein